MAESGAPTWDVVDVSDSFLYPGAEDGLFEPIDYSVVDQKRSFRSTPTTSGLVRSSGPTTSATTLKSLQGRITRPVGRMSSTLRSFPGNGRSGHFPGCSP